MPIGLLPASTIRILGSSQVITSPASLVKELIDNALDAGATSVFVTISSNTIDKIEVRDDGHGIAFDDLDALGRRGHTSKLRSYEELKVVGCSSLGFRGEALASAVELGEVSIITRTVGVAVAASVKLKVGGGIAKHSSISHPVGTTVSVLHLFSRTPVRRQNAPKQASKQLATIKELIQDYALARLRIKFTLKVVKSEKSNWSFSPRPTDGVKEAVSQVISRDTAAQCVEKCTDTLGSFDVAESTHATAANITDAYATPNFVIHAFLPSSDAEWHKISGGPHISVDSRPVSHKHGTPKKIITEYKAYLRNALLMRKEGTLKDPFIRIDIVCPIGSYDPNVEPSKDVVLFGDESILLATMTNLFKEIYGDFRTSKRLSPCRQIGESDGNGVSQARESMPIYLGAELPEGSPFTVTANEHFAEQDNMAIRNRPIKDVPTAVPDIVLTPQSRPKRKLNFDIAQERDACEILTADNHQISMAAKSRRSVDEDGTGCLNPWIIAKMNLPRKSSRRSYGDEISAEASNEVQSSHGERDILTPCKTSSFRYVGAQYPSPPATMPRQDLLTTESRWPLLDTWIDPVSLQPDLNSHHPFRSPTPVPDDSELEDMPLQDTETQHQRIFGRDFIPAGLLPLAAANSRLGAQDIVIASGMRGLSKPFKCPLPRSQPTISQNGTPWKTVPSHAFHSTPSSLPDSTISNISPSAGLVQQILLPVSDVDDALDYERRKDEATHKRRALLRVSASATDPASRTVSNVASCSPHKNRYNAAIAVLETCQDIRRNQTSATDGPPLKTAFPDGDPRAYLMRRRNAIAVSGSVLKRSRTGLLPLETISEEAKLHKLIQSVTVNLLQIGNLSKEFSGVDKYVEAGNLVHGFDEAAQGVSGARDVRNRLKGVMGRWYQTTTGQESEIMFNLDVLTIRAKAYVAT